MTRTTGFGTLIGAATTKLRLQYTTSNTLNMLTAVDVDYSTDEVQCNPAACSSRSLTSSAHLQTKQSCIADFAPGTPRTMDSSTRGRRLALSATGRNQYHAAMALVSAVHMTCSSNGVDMARRTHCGKR